MEILQGLGSGARPIPDSSLPDLCHDSPHWDHHLCVPNKSKLFLCSFSTSPVPGNISIGTRALPLRPLHLLTCILVSALS